MPQYVQMILLVMIGFMLEVSLAVESHPVHAVVVQEADSDGGALALDASTRDVGLVSNHLAIYHREAPRCDSMCSITTIIRPQ